MEKQPIDDLFSRKLRDAEVVPGADVFGRLQSRMNATPLPVEAPKRRLMGWWSGAAAACLLITLAWVYHWRDVPGHVPAPNAAKLAQRVTPTPNLSRPTGQPTAELPTATPTLATAVQKEPERTQLTRSETAEFATEPGSASGQRAHAQPMGSHQLVQPVADKPVVAIESIAQRPTEQLTPPPATSPNPVAMNPAPDRQPTAERVVVMTIDLPEKVNSAATEGIVKAPSVQAIPPQPALSQLVAKVRQLKNGELLLARATPPRPAPEQRPTGLGRLFSGVKESLRNENTLEP